LTETTADAIFSLIMACSRRLVELALWVREGRWQRNIGDDLYGWDVHGKTLGILGFGRIGQALARRGALGFGMPVLYHNRRADVPPEICCLVARRKFSEMKLECELSPAHYLWAVLIARIYEVFPLLCPQCGGQMRLIAFITEGVQINGVVLNMVLRIFLRVIAQSLQTHSPGAAQVDRAALHIGAVAFIHRFGSSLNGHVHFHVCAVDGVFDEVAVAGEADAQSSPPGIVYHPTSAIDETAVAQVQATLRRRILRAFVGRGLLESCDAKEMLAYQHSGFSVDAGVCIEAHDRAALERLLRYCARPPFAMDRLRKEGAALVYRCAKQHSEPGSDKRGAKVDELHLTPLELIARIAALVPPPRTHRHRYFGVLAPNSPLRAAAVALAAPAKQVVVQTEPAATGEGAPGVAPLGHAISPTPEPATPRRAKAHYLWAVLIARIYEVFPLLCPLCGGQMRLIAFITDGVQIRKILDHIGVDSEPPHISPARGPPLWDDCSDAQTDEGVHIEPDWDLAAQPAPDFEVDQRVSW